MFRTLSRVSLFLGCVGGLLHAADVECRSVGPGIEYLHKSVTNVPWSIHVLKVDRSRSDLRLVTTLPEGKLLGLSKLTDQVAFIPASLGKPIAGINGDFFSWRKGPYQGDPAGLQIHNGEVVSAPHVARKGEIGVPPGIACFWVDLKREPHISPVASRFEITFSDGRKLPFGLNADRTNEVTTLYTHIAGATTRTTNGVEFVLERDHASHWLPLQPGETYNARIRQVGTTNTPLDTNIVVLSLGPKTARHFKNVKSGDHVKISTATSPDLHMVPTAIGGGPILVRHGVTQQFSTEPHRDPRSAVGFNKSHVFFVVVDGRRKDISDGMTFAELATEMAQLGCTDALNLDGGGSAMLWVDGEIKNMPSDNHERPNGNSLVVVRSPHRSSVALRPSQIRGAEALSGNVRRNTE